MIALPKFPPGWRAITRSRSSRQADTHDATRPEPTSRVQTHPPSVDIGIRTAGLDLLEGRHLLGHTTVRTTETYIKGLLPTTVRPNETPRGDQGSTIVYVNVHYKLLGRAGVIASPRCRLHTSDRGDRASAATACGATRIDNYRVVHFARPGATRHTVVTIRTHRSATCCTRSSVAGAVVRTVRLAQRLRNGYVASKNAKAVAPKRRNRLMPLSGANSKIIPLLSLVVQPCKDRRA